MPELDAERRERLAEVLEEVVADLNNRGAISDGYGWTEIAEGLAPLVAGWLADDTAVCTTCQHRGGDDQPAQHPGCAAALGRIRAAALREALSGVTTHNGTPVTQKNLRWAATHEALSRSYIFDVLNGLADALDRADRVGGTR